MHDPKYSIRRCLILLLASLFLIPAASAQPDFENPEAEEIHDLVERAAVLVERDRFAACAAFKRQNSDWRFDDVYVFILDIERGEMLCHPQRPSLEDKSVAEMRDPDGRPILDLMLEQVSGERTSGWLHYLWPRPGPGRPRYGSVGLEEHAGEARRRGREGVARRSGRLRLAAREAFHRRAGQRRGASAG